MIESNITDAFILKCENISEEILNLPLYKIEKLKTAPFFLIIKSITEDFMKLMIYPIKKQKIVKINISGQNLSAAIEEISKILHDFQVIHTSGFIKIKEHYYYECYLNLSLNDERIMNLKTSLNKIKNVFKEIKIEEIGLKT